MISFKSVKIRLTLWYAFILTIFLSIFATLMHLELSRVLYRDVEQTLLGEAKTVSDSLYPVLSSSFHGIKLKDEHLHLSTSIYYDPNFQKELIRRLIDWEKENKKIIKSTKMMRLLGPNNKPFLSNLKGWEEEIIFPDFERDSLFMESGESFQTIHFRNRPIRLYYRLVKYQGYPVLILQTGVSTQEVKSVLTRLAFIIIFSIPGAVAVACVAGWFLVRRSFLPIDLMIRKAHQITGLNLQERLPRTNTGDEVDRLAETLNEMMSRIEVSTRAIQDFSSDISHEFKTPLAIIRGEIDLALRKSRTTEMLTETLRVIESEVNELIRLVDDLILLVRTDAKQLRFEMKPISLSQLVESVSERFQERARTKKIDFKAKAEQGIVVHGDSVYLKRVFNNLLDNAMKFTPEGGLVTLSLANSGIGPVVEVADTGMGIEQDKQKKVFSRFYRTDAARSQEGAGLGLNIARAICDAHGASIQLMSQVGHGTIVTVIFPL